MRTKKLFKYDRYLKECASTILNILSTQVKGQADLILDQTVFFPTGGGQSCDTGIIANLTVIDVFEENGIVHHIVEYESEESLPAKNSTVDCAINWGVRFLNMQRHCGEHILSGIFDREFGGVNRGFHMGNDYMTIDISLEKNPEITEITPLMLDRAEFLANEVIWENLPVIVRHFETKAEAENLPLRKPLTIENDISIVCVGNIENPSDCVACCGTHPLSAGSVGVIKIYKMEPNKGMFRIYFDAGKKALQNYAFKHEIVADLCKRFSAKEDTLIEKLDIYDEKNNAVKDELFHAKKSIEELLFSKFFDSLGAFQGKDKDKDMLLFENRISTLTRSDFEAVNKHLMQLSANSESKQYFFVVYCLDTPDLFLLSSGHTDCSSFKSELTAIGSKGGGGKYFAGFKFESREALAKAIDYLKKERTYYEISNC